MAQVFSLRDEVKVLEEKTRGVGGVLEVAVVVVVVVVVAVMAAAAAAASVTAAQSASAALWTGGRAIHLERGAPSKMAPKAPAAAS